MKKSKKRLLLEKKLKAFHRGALDIVTKLAANMGKGDVGYDKKFWKLAHKANKAPWSQYVRGQKELMELEIKENYPAFREYAKYIDTIGKHLPKNNRKLCYHPFSGLDFLWARLFKKLINEDIAFGKKKLQGKGIWWDKDDYSLIGRKRIIKILKNANLISQSTNLVFSGAISENRSSKWKPLNKSNVTLLLKRGVENLTFFKEAISNSNNKLAFGAIIMDGGFYKHSLVDVKKFLLPQGYKLTFQHKYKGPDLEYSIPYALGPAKQVAIFIKNIKNY